MDAMSPEAAAEKNRAIRVQKRQALEHEAAAGAKPLRRWARWALEPVRAAAHAVRLARQRRLRAEAIRTYLATDGFKGLQVGCGPYPAEGWQNTDYMIPRLPFRPAPIAERKMDFHLDITEALPYPDGALDAIFAEEVVEHVAKPQCEAFLREAARVLKPGGVLRLTTPDAAGVCRVYLGLDETVKVEEFEPSWLEAYWSEDHWLNGLFRLWGHQHLWSFPAMQEAMRTAGFSRIERVRVHETASGREELRNRERHGGSTPERYRFRHATGMIVEAFK